LAGSTATVSIQLETKMAKLVAVCRDDDFPFERRQIPLMIEEALTVRVRYVTAKILLLMFLSHKIVL